MKRRQTKGLEQVLDSSISVKIGNYIFLKIIVVLELFLLSIMFLNTENLENN